ncbi:MAG: POTRA domain-containing protein [Planctomycetales bacterium]
MRKGLGLLTVLFLFGIWCAIPPQYVANISFAADEEEAGRDEEGFDREFEKTPEFNEAERLPRPLPAQIPYAGSKSAPTEPLHDVGIQGNTTIPEVTILRVLKCRAGRVVTLAQIREDRKALYATRWFIYVDHTIEETDDGPVLVFHVKERPIVEKVEFIGNKKLTTKNLQARTGLKAGSAFSPVVNREAARRLEMYYREKGFTYAKVELEEGANEDDRNVVFKIDEGPKTRVTGYKFEGNENFSSAILATKLQTKKQFVPYIPLGGKYEPGSSRNDIIALKEYYHNLGYFNAKVDAKEELSEDKSTVTMHYKIEEGPRFRIRKVEIGGNQVLSEETLRKDLKLGEGQYFSGHMLTKDVESIKNKYGELGRLYAKVEAGPGYLENSTVENPEVDLVYVIDEDRPMRVRMIQPIIKGDNPHTKETVVLNQMVIAPGDLADPRMIKKSENRINGTGLFATQHGGAGGATKMTIRPVQDAFTPKSQNFSRAQAYPVFDPADRIESMSIPRGGRPSPDDDLDEVQPLSLKLLRQNQVAGGHGAARLLQKDATPVAAPKTPNAPKIKSPVKAATSEKTSSASTPIMDEVASQGPTYELLEPEEIIRGQAPNTRSSPAANPLFNNDPIGDPYGNPDRNPSPDQNPGWIDIFPEVTETQTGKIMFGAGYNSDNGLLGNIVLDETNFDIWRPPTSWSDFMNGTAWRGGGQQFRMEAVPGNQLSRYLISWRDPYFMNTNFSLGTSGFYFQRQYQYWNETRGGGRISVGRQWSPWLSSSLAFRLENVEVSNPHVPTPPILKESVGSNFLSTVRLSVAHDTRDSSMLATEGHFIELAYEQGMGDFVYPRADLDARQFFTLYQRPDGFGKHILSLRGQISYTGDNTPIFERLYAGGFQSFRGFQFRGVSPVEEGVGIGGQWLALGSVEYMFPVTASETIRGVVFSDFGTVENTVSFNQFRASLGTGVRISVPMLGPAPIALDLAWPVAMQDTDQKRIFSFYVGYMR